eukprot:TRINITY_DN411_c3_g1_i1.p1 TRINITY_DN411_c3_g1~~TRINITY_DN411_c3_g1_i1.p1  ORF type:complete len:831 (-),score=163.15 TRINITY_DN411_c3_g1_i1:5-2194(-)
MKKNNELPSYVKHKLYGIIAMIMKRGWLDPRTHQVLESPLKEEFKSQITTLVNNSDPNMVSIGIQLCIELVSEFSVTNSSRMNVPWEFHKICKQSFEAQWIQNLFMFGIQTIEKILKLNAEARDQSSNLLKSSLELLEKIIGWPFLDDDLISSDASDMLETVFSPGPSWRPLLLNQNFVLKLYFELFEIYRDSSDMLNSIVQGLAGMAFLKGDIFQSEIEQQQYLNVFSHMMFHFISKLVPKTSTTSECVKYFSYIIHQLATNFSYKLFQNLPPEFFQQLTEFTINILKSVHKSSLKQNDGDEGDDENEDSDTDPAQTEENYTQSLLEIMETWVLLINPTHEVDHVKLGLFHEHSAKIFEWYCEVKLARITHELANVKQNDDDEDEGDKADDDFQNIAHIARVNIKFATTFLIEKITKRLERCYKIVEESRDEIPSDIHEQIRFLVLISGHVISDDYRLESDVGIPDIIIQFSQFCEHSQSVNLVVSLISIIFKIVDYQNTCITNNKSNMCNIRVAQALMWFMNRWSQTYLPYRSSTSESLKNAYGYIKKYSEYESDIIDAESSSSSSSSSTPSSHPSNGPLVPPVTINVIEFCFKSIIVNLIMWKHTSNALSEKTCNFLHGLSALSIPTEILSNIKSWNELINAYSTSHKLIIDLSPDVQRKLVESLVTLDLGSNDTMNKQYFDAIVKPIKISSPPPTIIIIKTNIGSTSLFFFIIVLMMMYRTLWYQ